MHSVMFSRLIARKIFIFIIPVALDDLTTRGSQLDFSIVSWRTCPCGLDASVREFIHRDQPVSMMKSLLLTVPMELTGIREHDFKPKARLLIR